MEVLERKSSGVLSHVVAAVLLLALILCSSFLRP